MFTKEEEFLIKSIFFSDGLKTENDIKPYLPDYILKLLQDKNNLQIIHDKLIPRKRNRYRPYDTVTISKFLTDEFNLASALENMTTHLSGKLMIYIDFDFIVHATKDTESPYKFEFASKSTCLNETIKISTKSDVENIVSEFQNESTADLLNKAYLNHHNLNDYSNSGFQPHLLLACKIYLQIL